jgi:hypothetical protein
MPVLFCAGFFSIVGQIEHSGEVFTAMDREFHYFATGLIAKRAGFRERDAETIARSSQFVDENNVALRVRDPDNPERVYENAISQTVDILRPQSELMRIYPLFHFLPGDPTAESARRSDGKMHLLNTTPDSDFANELLDQACQAPTDTRLYRIGIASHAFTDTWAHQNFVGWYDSFNSMGFDLLRPEIGHAEAGHRTDWIGHTWRDHRLLEPEVDNTERFIHAARALFFKYCAHRRRLGRKDNSHGWSHLERELRHIFGEKYGGDELRYRQERLDRFRQKLAPDIFTERNWLEDAVDIDVRGLKDSHKPYWSELTLFPDRYYWKRDVTKEDTHWYRFQEAVKEHQEAGIRLLEPVFRGMGVELRQS